MPLAEGLFRVQLSELRESDENPRTISDERFADLKHALEADASMLAARPLIADPEGNVVCGNMRLRAMADLGWEAAPVYVHAFESVEQRREWMLRDNQEYGEWVPEELAALIAEQRDADADLKLLGFSESHVTKLLREVDEPGPGEGNPGQGGVEPEVWGLVVECETEDDQAKLLDELTERGLQVRALIP